MKFLKIVFFLLIVSLASKAQVGIGTQNPNASAQLDISSTNKGLLIPRLTRSERDAISNPATGLMVFQSDQTPGFYYYNGTNWVTITNPASRDDLGNHTAIKNLDLNGHVLTDSTGSLRIKADMLNISSDNFTVTDKNFNQQSSNSPTVAIGLFKSDNPSSAGLPTQVLLYAMDTLNSLQPVILGVTGSGVDISGNVKINDVKGVFNAFSNNGDGDIGSGSLNLRAESNSNENIALRIFGNNSNDYYSGGKIVFGDYTVASTGENNNGFGIYMEEESDENFLIKAKSGNIKIAANGNISLLSNNKINIGSVEPPSMGGFQEGYSLPISRGNDGDVLTMDENGNSHWESLPSASGGGGTSLQAGTGISINNATISVDNTVLTKDNSGNVAISGKLNSGAITYPNTDGTAGQVLKTDGFGVISWQDTPSSGGGGVTLQAGTGININNDVISVDNSVVTKSITGDVTIAGKITSGTITYPNADGSAGQVLKTDGSGVLSWTSLIASGRMVAVPLSSVGTTGDKKGDVALNGSYLYYCIQDFGGVNYPVKFSRTYSGRYPAITKGTYPSPVTGWKLIYAGSEYTIQNALGELGPNEWYFIVDRDISTNTGGDAILQESTTTNIWKRIAFGSDTW